MTNEGVATRFTLGQLVFTKGVNDKVAADVQFARFVTESLARHAKGDWGDLGQEDKTENNLALSAGNLRIFSAYEHSTLSKIWIITEADRSATTVLFPDEY
ncbi:hypothetical protein ES708_12893 [subsurface metagenome]